MDTPIVRRTNTGFFGVEWNNPVFYPLFRPSAGGNDALSQQEEWKGKDMGHSFQDLSWEHVGAGCTVFLELIQNGSCLLKLQGADFEFGVLW